MLLLGPARGHDHTIELARVIRFEQQRNVGDAERRMSERIEPAIDRAVHQRMHDGLEVGARAGVAKHHRANRRPIERAESFQHGRRARCAGSDDIARDDVGIDHGHAARDEAPEAMALARGDAARERHA